MTVRLVTLNTWKNEGDYRTRLSLMAEGLAALQPDAILLQECFVGGGDDTAQHLAAVLGLHAVAAPARQKLRTHDGRATPSSSGLAVLLREPPVAQAVLALTSDARDGERIAQRVDLPGGLRLLNLHLTHLPDAHDLRACQLNEALAWAQAEWSGALVAGGDLNCARGAPAMTPLEGLAGPEPGSTLHAHPGVSAIDHLVLAAPGPWRVRARYLALNAPDAAGRFPSDHASLVLDLEA